MLTDVKDRTGPKDSGAAPDPAEKLCGFNQTWGGFELCCVASTTYLPQIKERGTPGMVKPPTIPTLGRQLQVQERNDGWMNR